MLKITAVFPGEMLSILAFQMSHLMKNGGKRNVKGASI